MCAIEIQDFGGRPVAVFGLGKSGLAAARVLLASGAHTWAWDDDEGRRRVAGSEGIELVDLYRCDWREPAALILSPGIAHTHPKPHIVAARARDAGAEIIGDIELLVRSNTRARYVGVTGTNGKSTTTALIGHILRRGGIKVAIGGNLGTPALELDALGEDGTYVLELSSYQLELTPSLTLAIAVLLNITPDHLDRHGGMKGYVAAKRRIFGQLNGPRAAIIGIDDEHGRAIAAELAAAGEAKVIRISGRERAAGGVYAIDGRLYDDLSGAAAEVLDIGAVPTLPGAHNGQNAAAAYAAAKLAGLNRAAITGGIASYPGLPHRQELVATIEGIRFVNDSKATNADAAAKALASYETIYWIAGGRPKEGGITALSPWFGRVARAFLIGEAAPDFARTLAGHVDTTVAGTLDAALPAAFALARREKRPRPVVLLSPACASFDQFANFEARGAAFRDLVRGLAAPAVAGDVR